MRVRNEAMLAEATMPAHRHRCTGSVVDEIWIKLAVVFLDRIVVVPRLPFAVPNLHEPHAALDQPPRHQQLA